ncbi:MAG: hypothetical protein D6798_03805 [Deltaproteobacteria bacterium]|nr:MAG: hypothetical protein D6798_03805 [Deltaproteobacteria bacterium]
MSERRPEPSPGPVDDWSVDVYRARQELTLDELLRRCHRDELLSLAEVLRVNPEGVGTDALARIIAATLRRAGGHELANIVRRRGEGPAYPAVLRALAERLGTVAQPTLERTELTIIRAWLDKARGSLPPEQLDALVAVFEGAGAPTATLRIDRDASLPAVERSPAGRGAGLAVAGGALRLAPLFLPVLVPLTGVASLWWLGRPKDRRLLPAVLEVARLRQVVRHRVTVGVVGSPSSGKDAAIRAIFGIDTGNVHPVAGSTRTVSIQQLDAARALFVVNTPGLGDVTESVTEEARQVLHHIDVFVYLVNAQGGVQARELADYRICVATGRPVLAVVNKIDTIRSRDRDRYLADARDKLGAPADDFLAAAFDPLPQLAPAPMGVGPVRRWITRRLVDLGKDPTELPWVPSSLDAEVRPPGASQVDDGAPEDAEPENSSPARPIGG